MWSKRPPRQAITCVVDMRAVWMEALIETFPELPAMYGTQKITWEEAGATDSPGVRAIVDGVVGRNKQEDGHHGIAEDFEPADSRKIDQYAIKVEEVREKVMPEMDAAFFEALKVKDEAELREQITENIKKKTTAELSSRASTNHRPIA